MKVLFQFNIQSFTDVITNSSSELFVFNKSSKEEIINLLNLIHPNWRNEYQEPISLNEMDAESLEYYFSCIAPYRWIPNESKYNTNQTFLSEKFSINPAILYSNWEIFDPSVKYPIKDNYKTERGWRKACNTYRKKAHLELVDNWVDLIRPKLNLDTICLYSISDNPDWEYQEVLSNFAERHHLG